LPLTANGKVDRRALPAPEQSRTELGAEYVGPRNEVEEQLARIWSEVLKVERVGINDNFFELGGDSILSIQIVARAVQAGLQLTPRHLFQHKTIAELSRVVDCGTVAVQAEQGTVSGVVALTPIQQWFLEQEVPERGHYNQAVLLAVPEETKGELLAAVVQKLMEHHDALRLRFEYEAGQWRQHNAAKETAAVFSEIDLSELAAEQQGEELENRATQLQRSLDLSAGPLLRVALFNLGRGQGKRLLLVVHHLAVDGVSWRILLEDVQRGYEQAARGERLELPAKTSSYQSWATHLVEQAQSEESRSEAEYWLREQRMLGSAKLPRDHETGENLVGSTGSVSVSLSAVETKALLQEVPGVYHTQINDALLTAVGVALTEWMGSEQVAVELEGHGREELGAGVDVTRTVGWFTSIYPVVLAVQRGSGTGERLKLVKEKLRGVPRRGVGYGLLRYLSADEEVRTQLRERGGAEVCFNYLGQSDESARTNSKKSEDKAASFFTPARESTGLNESLSRRRQYLLEIDGWIDRGRLKMSWNYSTQVHRRETIATVAEKFLVALRSLIEHCRSSEAGGFTPSDFPLATGIKQEQLDQIVGRGQNIENVYALSPMQQGMLFHSLYDSGFGFYVFQMGGTLRGNVSLPVFEQAWQEVLDRHTILRSGFVWENIATPLQLVYRRLHLRVTQHDWRGLSHTEQEERLQAHMIAERQRGFDLSQAPLMRVALIRVADDVYRFCWGAHHLLLDGWSWPIVLKEFFIYYEAFRKGERPQLQQARPYSDYVAWLQRQDTSRAEAFWRSTLRGFKKTTSLGDERLNVRTNSEKIGRADDVVFLSEKSTASLRQLAREHQLTLNTVVQGAWALLLSRQSGERDVVFGATVSGRPAELTGVEEIVGPFINTLPVRVSVAPEDHVMEWLRKIQEQQAEMRQYEYSPLVEVQSWSEVPRGMPLFESILVFDNYPLEDFVQKGDGRWALDSSFSNGAERSLAAHDFGTEGVTTYPLTVVVIAGKRMTLGIMYDSLRFERQTISRMLTMLEAVLNLLVERADLSLGEIDQTLGEAERLRKQREEAEVKELRLQKFKQTRRRAVNAVLQDLQD
jgi:non-ribosomal peptide synthase protein (TIGR01720 family)